MKITFINHASIILESNNFRVSQILGLMEQFLIMVGNFYMKLTIKMSKKY